MRDLKKIHTEQNLFDFYNEYTLSDIENTVAEYIANSVYLNEHILKGRTIVKYTINGLNEFMPYEDYSTQYLAINLYVEETEEEEAARWAIEERDRIAKQTLDEIKQSNEFKTYQELQAKYRAKGL